MIKSFVLSLVMVMLALSHTYAQQLVESNVAFLSETDHFNSNGQRLTSAAAIIRQDRANYHRFGIRDPADQDESLFSDEHNRQALEQMLERGNAEPGVISRIVNGAALIRVDVHRGGNGPYIAVTLMDQPRAELGFQKPRDEVKDYTGPFTTQFLYTMCSRDDLISREKCNLYIQGLLYGLQIEKSMQDIGKPICLPETDPEAARVRILGFIDGITGGNPSNNKDGGDWMAFIGVAAGNMCK